MQTNAHRLKATRQIEDDTFYGKLKRRQRSGIDAIKNHTWPETQYEKVAKHMET